MNSAWETAPLLVLTSDKRGFIVYANRRCRDYLGIECGVTTVSDLYCPVELRTELLSPGEVKSALLSATDHTMSGVMVRVRDSQGDPVTMLASFSFDPNNGQITGFLLPKKDHEYRDRARVLGLLSARGQEAKALNALTEHVRRATHGRSAMLFSIDGAGTFTVASRAGHLDKKAFGKVTQNLSCTAPTRWAMHSIKLSDKEIGRHCAIVAPTWPNMTRDAQIVRGALAVIVPESCDDPFSRELVGDWALTAGEALFIARESVQTTDRRSLENRLVSEVHDAKNRLVTARMALIEVLDSIEKRQHVSDEYLKLKRESTRLEISIEAIAAQLRFLRSGQRKPAGSDWVRIRDIVTSLRDTYDTTCCTIAITHDDGCSARVSRGTLSVALHGVIGNAFHALSSCDQAGAVDISIREHIIRSNPGVLIEIRDNGPGIRKETLRAIHAGEPVTEKSGGSGLGLTEIRDLIRNDLHGQFEIQSRLGKGTSCTIIIPKTTE